MASYNNVEESKNHGTEKESDEDIKDLLESALDDFDLVKDKELANDLESTKEPIIAKDESTAELPSDLMMNQVYEQLFKEFNSLNENQPTNQPQSSSTLSTSQTSSSHITSNKEASRTAGDVTKTLEDALKSIDSLVTQPNPTGGGDDDISDADIVKMMTEMGMGGDMMNPNTSPEQMMPLMQNMMQNLLSKQLLYVPLKEIAAKYPVWLEEQEGKLEEVEMRRYKEQYQHMNAMVKLYEEEQTEDSKEVTDKRFDKLLDLMQNMQQLGTPPKEIAGDLGALETDEMGLPKILSGSVHNQCSIS